MEIIDCLKQMRPKKDNDYLCIKVRRYEIHMLDEIFDRIKKKGSFDIAGEDYDIDKDITKTDITVWSNIIDKIRFCDEWKEEQSS